MWRPLFGGDEDRNTECRSCEVLEITWRPLFGGDEDRNTVPANPGPFVYVVASPLRRGRGSQLG